MTKKRNLLILILIFAIALLAFTSCSEKPKLSELEDEEFIKYATDSGVNFPETFDIENDMAWIREWITRVEGDHNYPAPPYSKDEATFAEELREMFFKYYDGEFPEPSDENELSDLGDDELYQYIIDAGVNIRKNEIMDDTYSIEMIRYIIALLEDDIDYIPFVNPFISLVIIPETLVEELRPLVFEYIGLPKLSELKDDALLKCVTDAGIKFYEDLPNESRISILRFWIRWIENSPDSMAPAFGNEADSELFEEVRKFVFEYYDDRIPAPTGAHLLSHLGDDELIRYVTAAGIEIPTGYVAANIRALALILEEDINYEPPITSGIVIFTPLADFVEALRALVTRYAELPKFSELGYRELYQYAIDSGIEFTESVRIGNMHWIRKWLSKVETDYNYPAVPGIPICEEFRQLAVQYYSGAFPEPSDENELSDLGDDELYQYIIDAGVDVTLIHDPGYRITLIRYIIAQLEDTPEFVVGETPFNNAYLIPEELVETLRPVVAAYNANK